MNIEHYMVGVNMVDLDGALSLGCHIGAFGQFGTIPKGGRL